MKQLLNTYCTYNVWANQKIIDFLSNHPEEKLSQHIENSFPSLRKTMMHIMNAERSWLARIQQDSSKNKNTADTFNSTHDLMETWISVSIEFRDYIASMDDSFFEKTITSYSWSGTEWTMQAHSMIHHCMNHSTYHRGQLITMARQLDMKEGVPSTDLLFYLME